MLDLNEVSIKSTISFINISINHDIKYLLIIATVSKIVQKVTLISIIIIIYLKVNLIKK